MGTYSETYHTISFPKATMSSSMIELKFKDPKNLIKALKLKKRLLKLKEAAITPALKKVLP